MQRCVRELLDKGAC